MGWVMRGMNPGITMGGLMRVPVTKFVSCSSLALLVGAVVFTLAALPGAAWAQDSAIDSATTSDANFSFGDYDASSQAWNGLHTLTAVARGLGLTVESVDSIDWEDLGAEDILFVLYPKTRLEPGHIAAFVRNGGHVLLADDFGESNEALARLGMLRERAIGVQATEFYRGLPYVPLARPLAEHPLSRGIEKLATNHPSVLTEVQGVDEIFGFSASEIVVVAGELGSGRFVVCADPSIFINRMMQFQGNLDFAINALRHLARGDTSRRLVILAGDFALYGEPAANLDDGTVRGNLAKAMSDFNRWLEERNDYLLTEAGMRAVGVILAGVIGLLALLTLPLLRRSLMDGSWTRAKPTIMPLDDFEQVMGRYDDSERVSRRTNFLLAATVLRDAINNLLARVLEVEDPLYNMTEEQIGEGLVAKRGQLARNTYRPLHKRLKSLPTRVQAASPWSTGFFSKREFDRLYEDAVELYLALGEELG